MRKIKEKRDLCYLNISEAARLISNKEISCYELLSSVYDRIEETEAKIRAFITLVDRKVALKEAKKRDKFLKNSKNISPLFGIPFSVKDSFVTKEIRSTAASDVLKNYIGQYDATVVSRLKKAGAILIGKTNLDEFCLGFTTETSAFGPTSNPFDHKRVPGGSSGGSAASVSVGSSMFSIGSEHYDSIRQPAAWCGVVGFKPTYGTVSRYGIIAMASSLECPGPITKTVTDASLVLSEIYGSDIKDANSFGNPKRKIFKIKPTEKLRLGISRDYLNDFIDSEVKDNFDSILKLYKESGFEIKEISLPPIKHTSSIFEVLYRSEVASNLARYDGIRYPKKFKDVLNLEEIYEKTRQQFGPLLKYLIITDLRSISGGEFEKIYLDALKLRKITDMYFDDIFSNVDLVISPMSPTFPFKKGFYADGEYRGNTKTDKYRPFIDMVAQLPSLSGLPGISVPCGFVRDLPLGLNIYGPRLSEDKIFSLAYYFENQKKDFVKNH